MVSPFARKIFSFRHRQISESPSEPTLRDAKPIDSDRSDSKSLGSSLSTKNSARHGSVAHSSSSASSTLADTVRSKSSTVSADRSLDPLGLSLLYAPDTLGDEHVVDIIFVHGLGGSSRLAWCKSRRLDTFWPQEWLPKDGDLSRTRIFTFGYNAQFRSSKQSSSLGIADFSAALLFDMVYARDIQGEPLHLGKVGSAHFYIK